MAKYARGFQSIQLGVSTFNTLHQLRRVFDIRDQVLDMGPFPKENYLFGLEFQH